MFVKLSIAVAVVLLAPESDLVRVQALDAMNAGVTEIHKNLLDAGQKHLVEATQLDPNYALAWYNLGISLDRQGKLEEASKAFTTGITVSSGEQAAALQYRLGQVEVARAQQASSRTQKRLYLQASQRAFSEVVAVWIHHAQAYLALARVCDQLDQPAKADRAYRKAIEADPSLAAAFVGLGQMYLDYGHTAAGLAVLQVNVEVNQADVDAWVGLGAAELSRNQPDEAIVALKRAEQLSPKANAVLYYLGIANAERRERRAASDYLEAFLKRTSPDTPEPWVINARNTLMRMQDVI